MQDFAKCGRYDYKLQTYEEEVKMSLEELLRILSENLVVRRKEWMDTPTSSLACLYTYREVPKEVRTQFKQELQNHLLANLNKNMTYSFCYWDDRDAGIVRATLDANNLTRIFPRMMVLPQMPLNLGADENLQKVFDRLPCLSHPEWEEYGFRSETFFEIIYHPQNRQSQVSAKNLSPWLRAKKQK